MADVAYSEKIVAALDHPYSQSILILGFSEQGPVLEPVYLRTPEQAMEIFGSGSLVEAYREAYEAGGRYLYLVRLSPIAFPMGDEAEAGILEALPSLVDLDFHYFHLAGHAFDRSGILEELVDFCRERAAVGYDTHFILSVSLPEQDGYDAWLGRLSSALGDLRDFFVDGEDLGRCFSVVAQWVVRRSLSGYSLVPGAATYAGLVSAYSPAADLANKPTGLHGVSPALDGGDLGWFPNVGCVVFRKTVRRGIVVFRSVTMASPESDYYRFANYRVATEAVARIRSLDRKFLGLSPGSLPGERLEAAVDRELKSMVNDGILREYSFKVSYEAVENRADVYLVLVPYFGVEKLSVSTTLFLV